MLPSQFCDVQYNYLQLSRHVQIPHPIVRHDHQLCHTTSKPTYNGVNLQLSFNLFARSPDLLSDQTQGFISETSVKIGTGRPYQAKRRERRGHPWGKKPSSIFSRITRSIVRQIHRSLHSRSLAVDLEAQASNWIPRTLSQNSMFPSNALTMTQRALS